MLLPAAYLFKIFAFLIKFLLFSVSFLVTKLTPTYSKREIEIPINACVTEAISQATGRSTPRATKRLYVENSNPNNMDAIAPAEVPLLHKNPITKGINAPVVKKSDPIHAMVRTDRMFKAINNATMAIIKVESLPTITS